MGSSHSFSISAVSVLKILVAVGIFIVAVALISLANEIVSPFSRSSSLPLVIAGMIVLAVSLLAIWIFRKLEYV